MQLIKWNPARELFGLRNHMNGLFDDFFYPTSKTRQDDGLWAWNPAVDIYEEADNLVIKAEIPGVDREGIHVDVKDRVLTIKGERTMDNEVKEESYYRREQTYGRFERAFNLPVAVDPESIKAEYKDGVLKVLVPKPEQTKPKQISVH